ncbi:MAG: hypothetical protein RL141_958 [Candidatus Parcubacteria bacterium]
MLRGPPHQGGLYGADHVVPRRFHVARPDFTTRRVLALLRVTWRGHSFYGIIWFIVGSFHVLCQALLHGLYVKRP